MRRFGERVKGMRLKRKMSARELGQQAGYLDGSVITQIEKGEYNPPLDKIYRLAQVLDVPAAYFLMEGDSIMDELVVEAQRCSSEEQQTLAAFLAARHKHHPRVSS